jgi:predicted esterase
MENSSIAVSAGEIEPPEARAAPVHDSGGSTGWMARPGAVLLAATLIWSSCAYADTRVYLVRGWFGVFSTGLDTMAEELQSKGIKAEAIGHLEWKSTVSKIVSDKAAGETSRLVLVGHSQGANNAIDMARELEKHRISVDLVITLVPFLQDPVPSNVVRALNYYQDPGWGSPLIADPGSKTEIVNINLQGDAGIFHINIDKDAKIQAEVVGAIAALPP